MDNLLSTELWASLLSALLTIMVLSYLIGDNPLFRFAMHLFIGAASGYAGAIAWHNVLKPGLVDPLLSAGISGITDPSIIASVLIPWGLILILLLKLSPRTARAGALPMAILVGVGAAVVVGGALTGTILPQSQAAMESLSPTAVSPMTGETGPERSISVLIMISGTISTLVYFHFSTRRSPSGEQEPIFLEIAGIGVPSPVVMLRWVGQAFIAITFGVMYAGALSATILILAERVEFLMNTVRLILGTAG